LILWKYGLEPMQMLPLALLVVAFTLGALGVIYNGTFYLLSVTCAGYAGAMVLLPPLRPSVYAATFSVALAFTGWRCLRHKSQCAN
jgi:membrane protein implicated in regulation of membrane protease activity